MKYRYIYDPRAITEYEEAIIWYSERSELVSENFVLAVNEKLDEICEHPTRYRNTKKYFRETFLKKYPYSIVYFVEEDAKTVVIVSIFHSSRNPKKKYKRQP
ncbi:MAG: type toxin-antitoxin system RelE/ParE family toxin [Flavipsychrobacter sp.]|jgi:plasmid stabilization system protein ParE|nr:type toxin-antitoxin system RelE/ParE family toxin [Flavipsychrobacter sp.]